MTTVSLPLLDRIHVASPCGARWADMIGDDRVRHCAQCNLCVHNLTAMNRQEAEAVLARLADGRVCARFWKRTDGTVLTQDCLVGVARARMLARRALRRVALLIGLVGAAGVGAAITSEMTWGARLRLRALRPYSTLCEWILPSVTPPPSAGYTGYDGDVIVMPASAAPPPQSSAPKPGKQE
jgi:hypothetical protein